MYDKDIIQEEAILSWDDEKREADEIDKVFVKQAQTFIQVNIIIATTTCFHSLCLALLCFCG